MSLAIDANKVTKVLLPDGWHRVMEGSFDLDAYEIHDGEEDRNSRFWILQGGVVEGVPTTGFTFLDPDADGHRISGPLTALLAVEELS